MAMTTPCYTPAAALGAQALLQAWESAQPLALSQRADALLQLAWPEVAPGAWGTAPLGVRDARLLSLHEALFGESLELVADCPACAELLELSMSTADLQLEPGPADEAAELACEGYELSYRLPGIDDLTAAAHAGSSTDDAVLRLLQRLLLGARHAGTPVLASELPAAVIDRLQQDMARRDPAADVRVSLACPACGHAFERRFDVARQLWDELEDWAGRTLAEVHTLACAYGWSEPQVLALGAARRRRYLAMVQG
jgi:hypothetical protein